MTPTKSTTSRTAEFFARAIDFSGKTNREIAEEAGFEKPNFISMMALGQAKIPLNRIPALALACHVDAVHFLRMAMEEYQPEVFETIRDAFGEPLTANEVEVLLCYRLAGGDEEIQVTPAVVSELMALFLRARGKS